MGDRDLQGGRPAQPLRRALRPRRVAGQPRARPHPDGDREPRDDRALASVLDRPGPLPRAQRLALQPQPRAPRAAPRGDRVRDRQRHRGRRRLPDVAPARGRRARAGAGGGASRTSTASSPSPSARRTGFAVLRDPIACKPAVLAETDDWVAMASEYRAIAVPARAPRTPRSGSRSRPRSTPGSERWSDDRGDRAIRRDLDLARTSAARAQPAPARARRRRPGTGPLRVVNPGGRHAIAVGLDAPRRGRHRRARRLLLRRHEPARRRCACTATRASAWPRT